MINNYTKTRIGEIGQIDSNLDLIICSDKVINMIENCEQGEDSLGSDHFPVYFSINVNTEHYRKETNILTSKKTRWEEYIDFLLKKESIFDSTE